MIPSKKSIDPLKLAFDIDGVVAATMEVFLKIAREEYGIDNLSKEQITSYWLEKSLDVESHVVEEIVSRILHDPCGIGLEPIPGAREGLLKIASDTPLTFVTARPVGDPIREWLEALLPELPPNHINVVATGRHEDKARVLKEMKIRYFIEDHMETCRHLYSNGIGAVVFDQPWNQEPEPFLRVRSWKEIMELIGTQSAP